MQPADMVYVRWRFNLADDASVNVEQADIGVYGALDFTPADSAAWDTVLAAIAAGARSAWSTSMAKTNYTFALSLDTVAATRQGTDGKTLNEQVDASAGGSWIGSGSGSALPWENSLVIGLYAYQRGTFVTQAKSKRGRVYLPGLDSSLLAGTKSGLVSNTKAAAMRDQFGLVLSATRDSPGSTHHWVPEVLSKTYNFTHQITWLSVDNKVDTQRRRAKNLGATIQTVAF
jgi:hypothetical protein